MNLPSWKQSLSAYQMAHTHTSTQWAIIEMWYVQACVIVSMALWCLLCLWCVLLCTLHVILVYLPLKIFALAILRVAHSHILGSHMHAIRSSASTCGCGCVLQTYICLSFKIYILLKFIDAENGVFSPHLHNSCLCGFFRSFPRGTQFPCLRQAALELSSLHPFLPSFFR